MTPRLLIMISLTAGLAGCTEIRLLELSGEGEACQATSECDSGLTCQQGLCAGPGGLDVTQPPDNGLQDVETDPVHDADVDPGDGDPEDPGPAETTDLSDLTDGEPDVDDVLPDVEPDAVDVLDVADADALDVPEVSDGDAGEEVAPDGQPDQSPDVEVDTGPALPIGPGLGEPCDGPCDVGLVCLPDGAGAATCATLPQGLCLPCQEDGDCLGQAAQCVTLGDGKGYCGVGCANTANCPNGFYCGASQCRPDSDLCTCVPENLGALMGCVNQNDVGSCAGQTVCLVGGWSTCTAKPPFDEVCDNLDNDCDGITDEEPYYLENGQNKQVGVPCGIGQCAGGEVICAADQTATCSTNGLSTAEACADNVDNDCDGVVNEDCDSTDFDGDGVPNDVDCVPDDAGYYQAYETALGAPEPCCDPAVGADPLCDRNCDGQVISCELCDGDEDGFCPPEDCDDSQATIYPGAPEVCNDGVDQDCQAGDLLCQIGQDQDGDGYVPPADCNEGNPSVYPWAMELCDNLDNDCDGVTDEGNAEGGQLCGTTPEYCQSGIILCTHYGYGAALQCQGAVVKTEEICDGADNDCNGQTDEGWPELGQVCDGPDADLCANGVVTCLPDGTSTACGDEALSNILEVCNDIDDDCDGATDEFVCPLVDLDGDGFTSEGGGDCDDFRSEVYPGAPEPCCDPALGAEGPVLCDRNCDGIVSPCSNDDLDADGFNEAQGDCDDDDDHSYPSAPEKCGDGIDQDCSGQDLACTFVVDSDGDGFHSGVDCNDNNAQKNPWAPEVCNYVDDDCDGVIDEGNPTTQVGVCGTDAPECSPGTWVCVHDPKTYFVLEKCVNDQFQDPEICNGLDDDCDGEVDEDFYDLGLPCDGPDSDDCETGQMVCSEDGAGVVCGGETSINLIEVCDAVDNDCDGATDEGLSWEGSGLGQTCDGTGLCGAGVVVCTALSLTTCSTNPDGPFSQAVPEVCDGLDNDCDTHVDEVYSVGGQFVGETCDGDGECGEGIVECKTASQAACSSDPDGSASQVVPEICDGLDNDCDGHVDEELTVEHSPCTVVGLCGMGFVQAHCLLAEWLCDYSGVEGYEDDELTCDGWDNDCDGEVDEGYPAGEPCDGPDADLCTTGSWTCTPEGTEVQCTNETQPDQVEVCNGVDDDCDGTTDETDLSAADADCLSTGVCAASELIVVLCGIGTLTCDYSAIDGYEPAETLCDGIDNDCDGDIDEDLTYQGQPVGAPCEGKGMCSQGEVQCSPLDGTVICSTEPGGANDQSDPEACDGWDNDCDGTVDDGFEWNGAPIGDSCNGAGECGLGQVECRSDGLGAMCSTEPGGSQDQSVAEICDTLDNDCDGAADEAQDLVPDTSVCPQKGVCLDPALDVFCEGGAWSCKLEALATWEPDESRCDQLDNDCDGVTDEAQPLKDLPCDGSDEDTCATGTWTCTADGSGLECTNETGLEQPETCDQVDNDCDGDTDEGLEWNGTLVGEACDGLGVCGAGIVECTPFGAATCSTNFDGSASQADVEVCNGADDDCDGSIDNGLAWQGVPVGGSCDGVGACGLGVVECTPTGGVTCSSNPDGSAPQVESDDCDGLDNDCDGTIDEAYPDFGKGCDSPDDTDFCQTGYLACAGGQPKCFNDVPCVNGGSCIDPGFPATHYCSCLGLPCNINNGDSCTADGCKCNGGAPCQGFDKCTPGVGCE